MPHKTPIFWWKKRSPASFLLSPAGRVYGHFARRKMVRALPPQIAAPVLCIGNFTLGGAGKTPLACAFALAAKKQGLKPGIVSRGFGGSVARKKRHIHIVNAAKDSARTVGDEALLLAEYAPVAVGADRLIGAELLLRQGVNFIIMDDGFQSRRLYPDYALLAVDAVTGLGNGKIFPAGPLRAPLPVQLAYSDSIVMIGGDSELSASGQEIARLAARAGRAVAHAAAQPVIMRAYAGENTKKTDDKNSRHGAKTTENYARPIANIHALKGRRLLAFSGIGNPQKFFLSLEKSGAVIEERRSFADHHFFTAAETAALAENARTQNLIAATTAKDYMRLKSDGLDEKLPHLLVSDIRLQFAAEDFCSKILLTCLNRYKDRQKI